MQNSVLRTLFVLHYFESDFLKLVLSTHYLNTTILVVPGIPGTKKCAHGHSQAKWEGSLQ